VIKHYYLSPTLIYLQLLLKTILVAIQGFEGI